jgi:hypothetical protein
MTHRKAKRMLQESDDYLMFTGQRRNGDYEMGCYFNNEAAWAILLNLAIDKYHIRETLRNLLKQCDDYLSQNESDSTE